MATAALALSTSWSRCRHRMWCTRPNSIGSLHLTTLQQQWWLGMQPHTCPMRPRPSSCTCLCSALGQRQLMMVRASKTQSISADSLCNTLQHEVWTGQCRPGWGQGRHTSLVRSCWHSCVADCTRGIRSRNRDHLLRTSATQGAVRRSTETRRTALEEAVMVTVAMAVAAVMAQTQIPSSRNILSWTQL